MPPSCPPVMRPAWPLPPRLLTRCSGVGLRPLHRGIHVRVERPPVCGRSLPTGRSDEAMNVGPHRVRRLAALSFGFHAHGWLPSGALHLPCGSAWLPHLELLLSPLLPPRPFPLSPCHPYFIYLPAALLGVIFFLQVRLKACIPGTLVPHLFQVQVW